MSKAWRTPQEHPIRNARIEALVASGLSWGEAASRAGVSRNTVAGVIWRAQRRAEQGLPPTVGTPAGGVIPMPDESRVQL